MTITYRHRFTFNLMSSGNIGILFGLAAGLIISGTAQAGAQVSSIQTIDVPATPFDYQVGGIEYQWGRGNNQLMEGFTADGLSFEYALSADRVDIRRDDIDGVTTGEPCGIFVERLADGNASRIFSADYPSDGSGTGNCDIPAMLASRVINRGAVDLFSNQLPDAKNIERLDYIFDAGVLTPYTAGAMELAGHVAAEKAGNNPVKIAAILKLDIFGQPASYGPMVLVSRSGCADPSICYGITDLQHTYSFLQNNFNEPQSFPKETERSQEAIGMAFVSTSDLGLNPGQRYFGFSFFADDVDAEQHDLIDPTTFPNDTSDENVVVGDDADIYGGLSGYFLAAELNVTTGAVFLDVDGNGKPDDNEAGISDIGITLYTDVNNNGVLDLGVDSPLGDSIDTDMSGNFVFPGIPDGNYIVVMDETDAELPPGLVAAPGTNPHPLMIAGGDSDPVYFPFVNPDGGSTDGGGVDGGADSGTDGGGVDGGADSGTDGGGVDGGADSGTDGGGVDGGADSGTDGGGVDGGADSGTDGGGVDGGADSGTDGGGVDGGADSGTDGGGVDGGADDGGSDSGTDTGGTPIDDPSTAAVDDSFEINQGDSGTFDVLANDFDGAGNGLTLVSNSSSPNATITIIDNQISYVPNFGFHGTDAFIYTAQDSDGTQVSGNVTINVVRFSDLNNNMVNDFVECDCTNLTLETGVNGSGLGKVSLWSALVLIAGIALRRRTRDLNRRPELKEGAWS
ncbi:MAG: Ig-like domain-containing protein [Granulosicoccus sp.]